MHVASGARGGVSDHFLGVAKVKRGVGFRTKKEQMQRMEVIKVSELIKRVKEQKYAEKVRMVYERIEHQEIRSVEEEWKEFRDAVLECATEVCGCRWVEQGIKKGS